DLNDSHCAKADQQNHGQAHSQLDQRLTSRAYAANTSFCSTTSARSGSPPPGMNGTNAGAVPPTSTSTDEPWSSAQTHTGGRAAAVGNELPALRTPEVRSQRPHALGDAGAVLAARRELCRKTA